MALDTALIESNYCYLGKRKSFIEMLLGKLQVSEVVHPKSSLRRKASHDHCDGQERNQVHLTLHWYSKLSCIMCSLIFYSVTLLKASI